MLRVSRVEAEFMYSCWDLIGYFGHFVLSLPTVIWSTVLVLPHTLFEAQRNMLYFKIFFQRRKPKLNVGGRDIPDNLWKFRVDLRNTWKEREEIIFVIFAQWLEHKYFLEEISSLNWKEQRKKSSMLSYWWSEEWNVHINLFCIRNCYTLVTEQLCKYGSSAKQQTVKTLLTPEALEFHGNCVQHL